VGFWQSGAGEVVASLTCPFKCRSCGKAYRCKATNQKKKIAASMRSTCDGDFEDCTLYRLGVKMNE